MRNKITYFLLLFSFISFGQNMYLDPTFGASGKLIDPFFTQNPVKIHFENNKYILIGGADSIICLNYDGSKDTTFGNNGIVVYNSSSTEYFIVSGSKLVNGFIYVYGQVQTSSSVNNDDIFLIKISTSGILDSSFGVNGIIRQDFSSKDILNDIIILNDGKILGIGSKLDSAAIGHMILIKYNSNGTIDTNFDPNGFKNLAVPQSSSSTASNILNFENNFLVVGQSYVVSSAHYDLVMIKMDENGNYIPTFGTNGVKKMAISTIGDLSQYWIMDAKLNGNGLYFIRGHIWSYLNQGNELLKYNLNTDTMETLIYLPRRSPFYAFDNNQKIYITIF